MYNTRHAILAIVAALGLVAATTLGAYQQADAAPSTKYQVFVTLTDIPANTSNLSMNVTMLSFPPFVPVSETQIISIASPSEGQTVKFVLRVPANSNETHVLVCSNTADFSLSNCDLIPLPSKGKKVSVEHTPSPPI